MPASHTYRERELLLRVAEGDTKAFEEVFKELHPRIYTVVLRLCHSAEMAEDICQDCFLKAWMNRSKLPQMENFTGWLHTVAANLTYDALRKKKADSLREDQYGHAHEKDPGFTSTEKLLIEKEFASLIQDALNSLPLKQREVFELVKRQGLSRDEAAARLGVSPETVKSNLQIATSKFRAYCIARLGVLGLLASAWFSR